MILFDLPYAEYRAHNALGSTDLKNILRSPAHFRHARFNQKTTKSLDLGRAVHAYLLERDTFFKLFAVEPEGLLNKAKNPFKADWDKFKKMCADENKQVVTQDDWHTIKGISQSIKAHKWASKIFAHSRMEVSGFNGKLKARADLLCDFAIADVKTCQDATEFKWSIKKYDYDLQAAAYRDVFYAADGLYRDFVWIACEVEPPYCIKVFKAKDGCIEKGTKKYKAALEIYERCVADNLWQGYDEEIEEIDY